MSPRTWSELLVRIRCEISDIRNDVSAVAAPHARMLLENAMELLYVVLGTVAARPKEALVDPGFETALSDLLIAVRKFAKRVELEKKRLR